MALYRNPLMAAEPYEESQGGESPTETSPDALKAFYQDMERRDTVERKLSKRKSNSLASLWSRKSVKRNPTVTAPPAPPQNDQPTRPSSAHTFHKSSSTGSFVDGNVPSSRSIIPDAMSEMSPAFNKDTWAAVPMPAFKVRFHIHNPHGPRWYKNHHLIPPSQIKHNVRPPSFFSSSFPPISTTSMPERLGDPGLSRTPSHSPLPTPTSSQTRVADPSGKPRSRKTSQTTPDTVDLLDVTDPWGTNWHHRSPYDLAISSNPSAEPHDQAPNRARRASMTATQSQHQSVTPSPLSQSTSAVHLQPPAPDGARIPRKLSKRATPAVNNIFGSNDDRKAASAPVTPTDHHLHSQIYDDSCPDPSQLPKRMSVAPTVSAPSTLQHTSKKEKRGSVLGRLAKKFSILRRGTDDYDGREDSWHYVYPDETKQADSRRSFTVVGGRSASPEKPHVDPVRRIPPPSVSDTAPSNFAGPSSLPAPPREHDRSSSISVETPFSIGKLTIANPDTPDGESPNPFDQPPLPPEKPRDLYSPPPNHSGHARTDSRSYTVVNSPPPETMSSPQPPSIYSPAPISSYLAPFVSVAQTPPEMSKTPLPPDKSKMPFPSMTSSSGHGHMQHQRHATQEYPNTHRHAASSSVHAQSDVQSAIYVPAEMTLPPTAAQALVSETRNSTRLSEKPQPSLPNPSPPGPPHSTLSVPFPGPDGFLPPMERLSSLMSYDGSPLSTSSMLANPPTPHNPRLSISATPASLPPPPLPSKSEERERKRSSREPSPIDKTAGRQTETFKLIRSASGHVYASSETIVAAGQQWEVVESVEDKRKKRISSSRSKDKESSSTRKEKENAENKESRTKVETDRSHRSKQAQTVEAAPSSSKPKSTSRTDGHHGESSRSEEYQSSRKRDERDDERKSGRRRDEKEDQHRSRRRDEREEEQRSSRRREEREKEDERRRREEKEDERKSVRRREEKEEDERRRREDKEEERRRREEKDREEEHRRQKEKEEERRRREEKEEEEERRSARRREEREKEEERRRREEKEDERKGSRRRDEKDDEYRSSRRRDEDEYRSSRKREEKEDDRKSSRRREEEEESKSSRRREEKDEEHRSRHRRGEDRHRKSERKTEVPAFSPPDVNMAQPMQPHPAPNQYLGRPLERQPSTSTRPTSELPSAADMNALRAKEAWDMERLWKSRSMHGLEPDGAGPPSYIPASGSSTMSDDATTTGAVYGSSHTAFVVQTPFQGHPSHIYHSMPTAPPPIIYPSLGSVPSIHGSASSYDSPYIHQPYPESYSPPDPWPPSSGSHNPLPPPPQESPYQPASLSRLQPTNGHGRSSDYWTSKYTGITTAH